MVDFTLRQLRYFDALSQHGHFGNAADACAISQPALSVQIKELEISLGVVLFERSARHVRLTTFGEDFAERARAILRSVEELGDLARSANDHLSGTLRLGVIPTIAPYVLPRIVSALGKSHTNLDLLVRETVTPKLIDELADGKLDTAIVALPISEPAFSEVALFDEALLLVRPKSEAKAAVPSPDALGDMRLLLLEEGHCFRDQALSFCNIQKGQSRRRLDGSSLSTLVQMVGAEMGVTLIPEMATEIETKSANVTISQFDEPQPRRTVGMIWRKTSPLAAQLEHISEIIGKAAKP
jgi:LysR family hydrogen peroxide-inducible transcriptional activator